jgi:hypothetical protein
MGKAMVLHGEPVITVALTECPYHDADYSQESFIYEQFNHYRNNVNALGMALIDYPQWLIEGMNVCNRTQQKESAKKARA